MCALVIASGNGMTTVGAAGYTPMKLCGYFEQKAFSEGGRYIDCKTGWWSYVSVISPSNVEIEAL